MIASPKEIAELVKALQNDEGLRILIETIAERKAQDLMYQHLGDYEHKEKPVSEAEISETEE